MSKYQSTRGAETYYLGPTDTKGGRVKARTLGGDSSVTLPWDHALDMVENHHAALRALIAKLDWPEGNEWLVAGRRGGGYVWLMEYK